MSQAPQNTRRATAETTPAAGGDLRPQVADIASKAAKTRDDVVDLAGTATDLASAALDQGRNLLGSARDQATSYADRRKNETAETVVDLARSLRDAKGSFEGRENIQAFVDTAADGLEQLAGTIRDRSFQEIYGEVEAFARKRPVAVGAASVLAGFLLARFIKSSATGMAEAASRASGGQVRQQPAARARA
jgi:hypothetical protein